jgi:hypothetical protein
MDRYIKWAFLLMFVLILVVYATGTRSAVGGITDGLRQLIYALTGRDSNGTFRGGVGNSINAAGNNQTIRF